MDRTTTAAPTVSGSPDAAEPMSPEGPHHYAAFISYRHAELDRRWAKWLHRSLETYRLPAKLAIARGIPRRLGRCFRDEDELPASADLSREIDQALERSRFLVVVCTPRTPTSEWVNREVERFREMGRHDRILVLLAEGEPREAFPRALREIRRNLVDAEGLNQEQVEEVEPLAADVRRTRHEGTGHLGRMAKLRIAACIAGVTFDELRRREHERKVRRLAVLGAVLSALLLLVGGLAIFAVRQGRVARIQRNVAEAQRQLAEDRKRVADRRQLEAQASEKVARQHLADLYAHNGWARVDAGRGLVLGSGPHGDDALGLPRDVFAG